MKHLICKSWVLLPTILMMPSESFANSWTCHYADLTRNVVIFYPNEPARLPCKVYYTKPKENVMPRTLWKAENEDNYCARKAVEFINALESWGWQCSSDNDQ
ncbi:MAG: hypothetical protein KZQ96_21850 [Candidatus Thiodiazotropha sp. (ex Lucinoma borealis)]|nr:hypothetical protein [Candidatus Thiodiazotropha sp. (ex Lucinoma borealis)]